MDFLERRSDTKAVNPVSEQISIALQLLPMDSQRLSEKLKETTAHQTGFESNLKSLKRTP
eukprot:6476940-Amphidinium_carterae.1